MSGFSVSANHRCFPPFPNELRSRDAAFKMTDELILEAFLGGISSVLFVPGSASRL